MAKSDDYQCASCAKLGSCSQAVIAALLGQVVYCGRWEEGPKTKVKEER